MASAPQHLFDWCTRRIPGLTLIFSVLLSIAVIHEEASLRQRHSSTDEPHHVGAATVWTTVFALYSLFWQALTAVFYLRVCWALFDVTNTLETALPEDVNGIESHREKEEKVSAEKAGQIIHAIVIPNYKEEIQTLRETLLVLASHSGAELSYDIYLAMEGREQGAQSKASMLQKEFSSCFRSLTPTLHPPDLPGEHPSKGSNVAWAVCQLSGQYADGTREDVLVTIADSDTLLSSRHFAHLTSLHCSHPDTALSTIYPAPMVFDRNADLVPGPVRLTDIFWTGIALSGYHTGSVIAPTFSAYSIPLDLIDRAGGWDVDGESMGEDIHIFIKCFFALNGNLNVRAIPCAFSSVNVVGDGSVLNGMRARYVQGLRHMWGALDCGYVIRQGIAMWKNRNNHVRIYSPLHAVDRKEAVRSSESTQVAIGPPNWIRLLLLWHRLLELYFMPISLIMTIANTVLLNAWQGHPPAHLVWIFSTCSMLGAAGIFGLFANIFFYSRYHDLCLCSRQKEMRQAGLSDATSFAYRGRWANWLDLCFAPVVVVVYGVAPTIQATMMHFWTLDLNWIVTKKREGAKEDKAD